MRKLRLILFCVFAFALAVPLASNASSTVERIEVSEKGVHADWAYTDEAGTQTLVSVIAFEASQEVGGDETQTPIVSLSIVQFGSDLFPTIIAEGTTEQFDMTIDNNLSTAHLNATLLVTEVVTGTIVPATIDLTWTTTGPRVKTNLISNIHEVGFTQHTHFKGESRDAQATGSVFMLGTEFAAGPSVGAAVYDAKDGSVTITIE